MAFKELLLVFSVLLIAKETLGIIDCETSSFFNCRRPKLRNRFPGNLLQFRVRCQRTTTYIRCLKEYQDKCGFDSIGLFSSPDVLEAYFNTTSELCEEGTSLYTVATENLQCLNETLSKTNCLKEARNVSISYIRQLSEEAEFEPRNTLNLECLEETLAAGCVIRAISENCGKPAGDATFQFIHRSKILENICPVQAAKSVLDVLDSLSLSEDKKQTVTLLLEKPVEPNND